MWSFKAWVQQLIVGDQRGNYILKLSVKSRKFFGGTSTPLISNINRKFAPFRDFLNTCLCMRLGSDMPLQKNRARKSNWSRTKSLIKRFDSGESSIYTTSAIKISRKDWISAGMKGIKCSTPTTWTKDTLFSVNKFQVRFPTNIDIE